MIEIMERLHNLMGCDDELVIYPEYKLNCKFTLKLKRFNKGTIVVRCYYDILEALHKLVASIEGEEK